MGASLVLLARDCLSMLVAKLWTMRGQHSRDRREVHPLQATETWRADSSWPMGALNKASVHEALLIGEE